MIKAYRAVHQQAFIPIFTENGFDSHMLLEACLDAGCRAIEYTLRSRDVGNMIPWIRRNYPDLFLLVGSTLGSDRIVRQTLRRHPQLMTLDELAGLGVDGFVSMVGFHEDTIQRYAPSHLMIPTVMTLPEAFQAVAAGAHFCKMIGPGLDLVRLSQGDGGFGFCPPMVTGGISLCRIPETISAGAVFVGTGFELILKDHPQPLTKEHVTEVLREYLDTAQNAQRTSRPVLAQKWDSDMRTWLNALPHHHPFEADSMGVEVSEEDLGNALAHRI